MLLPVSWMGSRLPRTAVAALSNLVNVVQAAWEEGLVAEASDLLNTTLGLFGFLVLMALAMSARVLPMYGGRAILPEQFLGSLAGVYFFGLVILDASQRDGLLQEPWARIGTGLGMALLGGVVLVFLTGLLRFMSMPRQRSLSPTPFAPEKGLQYLSREQQSRSEREKYSPSVRVVASAYLWAGLAAALLLVDGASLLVMGKVWFAVDAARHSFALGFLTLLIASLSPRMLSGFSGRHIVSAKLVWVTLWLGNAAAMLRVGATLLVPLLASPQGSVLLAWLLALSGGCGLLMIGSLTVNLWPTLSSSSAISDDEATRL